MKTFYFFLFFLFLAQCKKTENVKIDIGLDYYPSNIGHWQEYAVDSISFNDFTIPVSIDTTSFHVIETIDSPFVDLSGDTNYIVTQSKKLPLTNYFTSNIFTFKKNLFHVQKVENDLRYIKFTFPPKKDNSWNGHIYIDIEDEETLEYLDTDKYNWKYSYTEVDEKLEIGTFTFDSCVTIVQIDEENIFEKKYSKEIYAKNIGLVYKELLILETQAAPSSADFIDRAEKGFILKYTIVDYKQ